MPVELSRPPIITNWVSYTPVTQGLGTISNVSLRWRRVGSNLEINGNLRVGTVTLVEARIHLPIGLLVFTQNTIGGSETFGYLARDVSSVSASLSLHSKNNFNYLNIGRMRSDITVNPLFPELASNVIGNNEDVSIRTAIPIQGWNSNL